MYHVYVSHISSGIQNSFIQINSITPQHITTMMCILIVYQSDKFYVITFA